MWECFKECFLIFGESEWVRGLFFEGSGLIKSDLGRELELFEGSVRKNKKRKCFLVIKRAYRKIFILEKVPRQK